MKHPLITTNPNIEGGKPIIKGTRITIEMLANEYMAGRTVEQLHYSYPHLTHEQIEAALAYAADMKVTSVLTD